MTKPACTITVQTQDSKMYRKDQLGANLNQAMSQDLDIMIDFNLEGCCAESLGLYRILDEFCETHAYDKTRVCIRTCNMVESHEFYRIDKQPQWWMDIPMIQRYQKNRVIPKTEINKHFGCFIGRSTWARLWVSTYLAKHHGHSTIQTYHYDRDRENCNGNGYVGLDDLFRFDCDIIPDCAEFLMTCPRTIDLDFLQQNTHDGLFKHRDSYYPIHPPANLNILKFYPYFFVDVVAETTLMGNTFQITEKLWRCILAKRPFVVLAPANFLHNLRRLGFRTFHDWWDEDYDGQQAQTRINMMFEVIQRVATWDLPKCERVLNEMNSILQHNLDWFMQLSFDQISQTFDPAK